MIDPEIIDKSKIVESKSPIPEDSIGVSEAALKMAYPYLGHRDYTHGSSMIEGMLKSIHMAHPYKDSSTAQIRQFRIIRQFANHATAESMKTENASRHPRLGEAQARLDMQINGEKYTSLLFSSMDPINWRLPEYNAADYVREVSCVNEKNSFGRLQNINDFVDLIRGVNEINRQLTVSCFPEESWSKRVRWAYIKKFPFLSDDEVLKAEKVSFGAPKIVDLKNHRFEIKEAELEGKELKHFFQICFFIELS
ncbi:hypothetical protein [Desulfospira joergensenii]|uniref:hypothetical protein n=1 Tax=Desulfospira joergensenii TaxID=53329 RepID=UPI0003B46FF1|nr:hypothetical protein [Desulfospira joergensenii]